jgi:hypothetical protein
LGKEKSTPSKAEYKSNENYILAQNKVIGTIPYKTKSEKENEL